MRTTIFACAALALSTSAALAAPLVIAAPSGQEPYSAPTPQYAPMKSEPVLPKVVFTQPSLFPAANDMKGPGNSLEPYSAPNPVY